MTIQIFLKNLIEKLPDKKDFYSQGLLLKLGTILKKTIWENIIIFI